jgi:hypothetical protein
MSLNGYVQNENLMKILGSPVFPRTRVFQTVIKRRSMKPSSMIPVYEALVKNYIFDFVCAFERASSKTTKPKFSAHLDVL